MFALHSHSVYHTNDFLQNLQIMLVLFRQAVVEHFDRSTGGSIIGRRGGKGTFSVFVSWVTNFRMKSAGNVRTTSNFENNPRIQYRHI